MTQRATNEKNWLVKSSGMIVGPLSLDEIIKDIKLRKITMIDEVRSPETRWKFIREHEELAEVIEEVRNDQAHGKEDTVSTFVEGLSFEENEDFTPAPYPLTQLPASPPTPEPPPPRNVESPSEKNMAPTAVAKIDPNIQKIKSVQRDGGSNLPIYGLLLILIGLIGYAVFQYFPRQEIVRNLGYEDYVRLARSNKNLGYNEKALEFFRKAESLQKLDVANQLSMVSLLMKVENQNVQARQILEKISAVPGLDEGTKLEIKSLTALSYLREGQLTEARRRYAEIIKSSPDLEKAQINLIEIQILQAEFEAARDSIASLMRTGLKDPILLLYRSLASYRIEEDPVSLDEVLANLKRFYSQYQDYRAEVVLLQAAVLKKMNKDLDTADAIRKLLAMDPDLTDEHMHDLELNQEVLSWGYLGNICEILIESGGDSPTYKGLEIYCDYQRGEVKQALEKIEKARARTSNDLSLLGLHAFLLFKAGRTNEANSVLQLPRAGESGLAQVVKAKLCQQQRDWNCAEKEWQKVRLRDSQNIAAISGLGKVAMERGQIEPAQDYLKQGLLISENYAPLLRLKDELNAH